MNELLPKGCYLLLHIGAGPWTACGVGRLLAGLEAGWPADFRETSSASGLASFTPVFGSLGRRVVFIFNHAFPPCELVNP
jgi:hypothetical protein